MHSDSVGEVKRLFCLPETQGKGIGRKILEEIVALAEEKGLCSLVLETGWNYEAAIRLYEAAALSVVAQFLTILSILNLFSIKSHSWLLLRFRNYD